MEDLLSDGNPLYRRFTLSLLLKEMDYYDSSLFYPSFSNEDKVRLYAAFGGVPFYNRQINPSLSVEDNIILLLSGKFSHLQDETAINIRAELSKINNANAVFSAIAGGAFHYSDIFNKSHIASSPSLSDILEKLLKMDLVEYVAPINDKNNKTKSGYRISDNTTRFYYRYLFHNLSALSFLSDKQFYQEVIKEDFDSCLVPNVFETMAKQHLARLNSEGKLSPLLFNIGTYWYNLPKEKKNGQFDVVGEAKNGYVFYEVKFTASKIDDHIIKEEIDQVSKTALKPIQYGFVSRSGFSLKEEYPYQFITMDEMYAL